MVRSLLIRPLLTVAAARQLYEEDLLASMPQRARQWKQMEAYAASLGAGVEPKRKEFRARIGYPPPGFEGPAKLRLEKAGEDALATYYRCYISVTPQMETYRLYLVPKSLRGCAPLVISLHGGGGFPEMAPFHGGTNYPHMESLCAQKDAAEAS
jgi:hypothetical protein